jgi:hypothetical protein
MGELSIIQNQIFFYNFHTSKRYNVCIKYSVYYRYIAANNRGLRWVNFLSSKIKFFFYHFFTKVSL